MKKNDMLRAASCLLLVMPFCFSACIKDQCKKQRTYTYFQPIYKTKDDVRANIRTNAPRPIENPGKIYVLGHIIFLNEIDKGIHIIDNSNPTNPQNTGFIDIPGNLDIAVKGTTLYADLYTDLVTIDISNPSSVRVKKIIDNIFPHRYYGNGFTGVNNDKIIVEWMQRDTTVTENCESDSRVVLDIFTSGQAFFNAQSSNPGVSSSPVGTGGSTARFTIINNRLYTVNQNSLDIFNITNTNDPQHTNTVSVGASIETIYPFKNKLFIGSGFGMYIYDVDHPDAPSAAGELTHVTSCDPVIADDDYAYVTLRSGNVCGASTNELQIVKVNDFIVPTLLKTYPMTNPHGLSKDGNLLFICDGSAGLRIFNASNVMNLQPVKTIEDIDAYDVITGNHNALVVGKNGLYQYDYANLSNVRLLSSMPVIKK